MSKKNKEKNKEEEKEDEKEEVKVFSSSVLKRREEAEEFVKKLKEKQPIREEVLNDDNIEKDKKRLKKWKKDNVADGSIKTLENIIAHKENKR